MKTAYLIPVALLLVIGCSDANINDPARSTTATEDMERHEVAKPVLDEPAPETEPTTGALPPTDPSVSPPNTSTDPTSSNPLADDDASSLGQNENQSDLDATANIRSKLEEANLSASAQTIEITSQNGQITLNGEVSSQEEKDQIEKIATDIAGAGKVTNNLQVSQ